MVALPADSFTPILCSPLLDIERMQHGSDNPMATAATHTPSHSTHNVAQPPPLLDSPSQELTSRVHDLLARHKQPNAPPEAFHQFLTGALESVLREPLLHWWCHSDLRPISMELLHLFSLTENNSLQRYKSIIDHTFAMCVQCSEAYIQDRRIYLETLRQRYDEETVDDFFKILLDWDFDRLLQRTTRYSQEPYSPSLLRREKFLICELMLDPTLLLLEEYSARIADPVLSILHKMLQSKKFAIKSALPGTWLLMLHSDHTISTWALATSTAACAEEKLGTDRWKSWEQFAESLKLALTTANGQQQHALGFTVSRDPTTLCRTIRSMVGSVDADVLREAVRGDKDIWDQLQQFIATIIQDPQSSPVLMREVTRMAFGLITQMKWEYWSGQGKSTPGLAGAVRFFRTIFTHPGTLEYIATLATKDQHASSGSSSEPALQTFAQYTIWTISFVKSFAVLYSLPEVLEATISTLLETMSDRMIRRSAQKDSAMEAGTRSDFHFVEFDLEMLTSVYRLLDELQKHADLQAVARILEPHWSWIACICALGPSSLSTVGLNDGAAERVQRMATQLSDVGKGMIKTLLEAEVEVLWNNYSTATGVARAEKNRKSVQTTEASTGDLEAVNTTIWLRLAQSATLTVSDEGGVQHLMEWQTALLDQVAKLALLPRMEIKPSFSKTTLDMCAKFNDDLAIITRAILILLKGFAGQGDQWLRKLIGNSDRHFLAKLLKLWCNFDADIRTQALFIMRSAWQEVTRASCLRLAFQVGGDRVIQELDSILRDFRDRGSPGGGTPAVLFELLLESVTILFLNNSIDGEGGLYLQIFLTLTSSQEIVQHLSLIKNLWNSIWISVEAAFTAGRSIWAEQLERGDTIKTMIVVANVGRLVIGKIRYFERLLEFEKAGLDMDGQDQDMMDDFSPPSAAKETMPLADMKEGLPRMIDWTFAQDTTLCTSAIELVCAVLELLADHNSVIGDDVIRYLSKVAEGDPKVKSLLTPDQREALWIVLSRHTAYADGIIPPSTLGKRSKDSPKNSEPIEISDDDFDDLGEIDLTSMDFDDEEEEPTNAHPPTPTSISAAAPARPPTGTTLRSEFPYRNTVVNNPYQSKLSFGAPGLSSGIPAGGSASLSRRLPTTLKFKPLTPSKPAAKPPPVVKGSKLSQMRRDHVRERHNIVEATKQARQAAKPIFKKPIAPSESDTDSDSDTDDKHDNGLGSLIDAEETWHSRSKPQEPRKTKLLELTDIVGKGNVVDTVAIRRKKVEDDVNRHHRLTPNLAGLHAQILQWEVSATGDRPPNGREYAPVPQRFESVDAYVRAFEPLLVLECWQQLIAARGEVSPSSDSITGIVANRVSINNFQDTHMKIAINNASSLSVEDIVVLSDPATKDIFTAVGNAARAKPFFAKVQSITKAKGQCEVVFRTHLKIEESSSLMFIRPQTTWSILKMINLTTTHREYAALVAMRYYELRDHILSPPDIAPVKPSLETVQKVMDVYKVNTPQAQAIVAAIEKPVGFTLIQGPPGTGKTKTILGLVGALLADGSRARAAPVVQPSRVTDRSLQTGTVSRILVCAPSNAAIDEIVKRLKGGIRNTSGQMFIPKVIRVGNIEAVNVEVQDVALDTLIAKELESASSSKDDFQSSARSLATLREKLRGMQQELEQARLEHVQAKESDDAMAVNMALSKIKALNKSKWQLGQEMDSARLSHTELSQKKDQARKDARNKILGEADVICSTLNASGHDLLTSATFTFETVIIDEAAQSVEISSLIPLKYGCKRCILVGDPNQLPPTVISQLAAEYDYNQSLFVRIQKLAPTSVRLLSIQYRMHPDISVFPSREFYNSLLRDGPNMDSKTKAEWHRNPVFSPYRFFDVYDGKEETGLSQSHLNVAEAKAAVALLEGLCNGNPTLNFFRRVGVISPYKQQVRTLKDFFQRAFDKTILEAVDFNTVDGFQGQEKDIIIFSCVRASTNGSVGFLSDIRRMNVALTRARSSLFILGNADTLRRKKIWGNLVRDAEERGFFTKVERGVFGPRGATAPKNILQPRASSDRKSAGVPINQPMATLEDLADFEEAYPIIPETDDSQIDIDMVRGRQVDRRPGGTFSHSNSANGQASKDSPQRRSLPSAAPAPRHENGHKRKQDTSPDTLSSSRHEEETKAKSNDRPSARTLHALPERPPSPKRAKPQSSLFIKRKPLPGKPHMSSSGTNSVPLRERLAAGVIPIQRSYPSGPSRPPAQRPVPPKPTPSLDDILGSMRRN